MYNDKHVLGELADENRNAFGIADPISIVIAYTPQGTILTSRFNIFAEHNEGPEVVYFPKADMLVLEVCDMDARKPDRLVLIYDKALEKVHTIQDAYADHLMLNYIADQPTEKPTLH
jgi:hypothetical protein